jgi:hypothetical protein
MHYSPLGTLIERLRLRPCLLLLVCLRLLSLLPATRWATLSVAIPFDFVIQSILDQFPSLKSLTIISLLDM